MAKGLQQAQGEMLAAIGESPASGGGQAPAVAGAAGSPRCRAGLDQLLPLKAAQVPAHHLHRHPKLIGQLGCGGFPPPQQQRQGSFMGGGRGGRHRLPSLASGDGNGGIEVNVLHLLDQRSALLAGFLKALRPMINPQPPARLLIAAVRTASCRSLRTAAPSLLIRPMRPA